MGLGLQEALHGAGADDVIRWGGDVRDAAHPVRGVANPAKGRQRESGTPRRWLLVGRKGQHTCQKDQTVSRIPGRAARGLSILTPTVPRATRTSGTSAGWNC